jgi:hypothetical protein
MLGIDTLYFIEIDVNMLSKGDSPRVIRLILKYSDLFSLIDVSTGGLIPLLFFSSD